MRTTLATTQIRRLAPSHLSLKNQVSLRPIAHQILTQICAPEKARRNRTPYISFTAKNRNAKFDFPN